jgi:hypothetical protein
MQYKEIVAVRQILIYRMIKRLNLLMLKGV